MEIIVNGRRYDAETGQLLENSQEEIKRVEFSAENFHQKTQKSQTLNRRYVKAPEKNSQAAVIEQFKRRHDLAEEKMLEGVVLGRKSRAENSKRILTRERAAIVQPISRDASKSETSPKKVTKTPVKSSPKKSTEVEKYRPHPLQERAYRQIQARRVEVVLPSMAEIKQNAIASALSQMSREHAKEQKTSQKSRRGWWIFGGSLAILVVAGAGILMNLPKISAEMASARSGFSASIPQYSPEGFKLKDLPYFDGKSIVMRFADSDKNYEVKQIESSWDSDALLENYVLTKWGEDYITYREKGLTIFRKDGVAVWVNAGRMFEISGAEEISAEEIVKIAVSF